MSRHHQWPDGVINHAEPNLTFQWKEQINEIRISVHDAQGTFLINYQEGRALLQALLYLFGPLEKR